MKKLTKEQFGEWAIITGASSGIGREMALLIAKKGINTVLIARSENKLNSLSLKITKDSMVQTKIIVADLNQENDINRIISESENLEVGLLINGAGYALTGEFIENNLEDELNMINVNLKSPLILTHHFAKKMKKRQRGGILFLSSIMALAGASKWANYNATKAHNLILSEGIAQELKKDNIKVTALIVGSVKSGFQERSNTQSPFFAMSAKRVAKVGLWMLLCRRTYVVGFINKLISLSTRLNPRIVNSYIFSFVVNQLSKKAGS